MSFEVYIETTKCILDLGIQGMLLIGEGIILWCMICFFAWVVFKSYALLLKSLSEVFDK